MLNTKFDQVKPVFAAILQQQLPDQDFSWLEEKIKTINSAALLTTTFVSIPRRSGKAIVYLTPKNIKDLHSIHNDLVIKDWTLDRLARVFLLMHADSSDKEKYTAAIDNLFDAAEMQELVALYSALPFLAYPEHWVRRCAEGIRSNIGDVLQAIMCNNVYPSGYLNEAQWNQLVLKAFFTEKPVQQIIGLDKRANPELANILVDYAHERWAAHRNVNPQLWRCVGKFIDARTFTDIEKAFNTGNSLEKKGAALACHDSNYPAAKELLDKNLDIKKDIETGRLTWNILADEAMNPET